MVEYIYATATRVRAAYDAVRNGFASARFMPAIESIYVRHCASEFLSLADIVTLEAIEVDAWHSNSTNGSGPQLIAA